MPNTLNIKNIWDAEIVFKENNILYIDNLGYNANIQPGKTIEFGFTYTEITSVPKDFKLYQMKLYNIKDFIFDMDNDGISDNEERDRYHTNPNASDTDSDGLNDYFEIFVSFTNPLKSESNGDGIWDGEEINKYKTNPLEFDTDNDDLSDGDEIILQLDPLLKDTGSTGVLDCDKLIEQTINQTIEDGKGISLVNLTLKGKGNINDSTFIDNVYDISNVSSHKALIGVPIEIETTSDMSGKAIITFNLDESVLKNRNLGMALYDEEKNTFKISTSKTDEDKRTISSVVSSFGQFCLVDKTKLSSNELKHKLIKLPKKVRTVKNIQIKTGNPINCFSKERPRE